MKKTAEVLKKYRKWVMILAIFGIGLASYLFYEYKTQSLYGICNINSVLNCAPVTTGDLAEFMGIPVALIGGVGYMAILGFTLKKQFKWAFGMATFGMLFCLRLMILEIFVENVLCLICVACQIVMLIIFFLTYQLGWPEKAGLIEKIGKKEEN